MTDPGPSQNDINRAQRQTNEAQGGVNDAQGDVNVLQSDVNSLTKEDIAGLTVVVTDLVKVVRSRLRRFGIVLALASIAGCIALYAAYRANQAVGRLEQDQLDRRVEACARDNKVREGQRLQAQTSATSAQSFARVLIGDRTITPELQVRLDQFNQEVVAPFRLLSDGQAGPFAVRDCSKEAIRSGV